MPGEQVCRTRAFEPQPAPDAGAPETTVTAAGKTNPYRSTYSAPVLFCPATLLVSGLVSSAVMAAWALAENAKRLAATK